MILLDDVLAHRLVGDERAVLARDDDGVDADRLVAVVLDGDLRLAVRAAGSRACRRGAAHDSPRTSLCASMIGSGISSSVSVQAKPNISPWSPAPPVSTPMAMSGDWL